eukprot:765456-Hanusia_phi.AAC.4
MEMLGGVDFLTLLAACGWPGQGGSRKGRGSTSCAVCRAPKCSKGRSDMPPSISRACARTTSLSFNSSFSTCVLSVWASRQPPPGPAASHSLAYASCLCLLNSPCTWLSGCHAGRYVLVQPRDTPPPS